MAYSYYPTNPDWNDAAVVLDLCSTSQLQKIIALIDARGPQIVNDLKGRKRNASASLSPLIILDTAYVPSEDLEDLSLGLATILVSQIRKPVDTPDTYAQVLKDAFGLPELMADRLAKSIETEDILGGNYKDPKGNELDWFTKYRTKIVEFAKRAINTLPGASALGWEIDPTQKYDIDKLYEWKLLGTRVRELNSRSRLMAGQAMLNSSTGMFALGGDVFDGDPETEVGDALHAMGIGKVPAAMMQGVPGLHALGTANTQMASEFIRKHLTNPETPQGRVLQTAMNAIPGVRLIKRITPSLRGALRKSRRGSGDIGDVEEGDAYSTIESNYGSNPAIAWQMGDVEGFLHEVGALGDADVTTGDPELDSAIETAVTEEIAGDVENMSPEMGGIFMRSRINAAKRKAMRRGRKTARREAKWARKGYSNDDLILAKEQARYAGYSHPTGSSELSDDNDMDTGSAGGNETLPFPEV